MRGNLKAFSLFDSPHPSPLPQGEGVFLLNLMAVTRRRGNGIIFIPPHLQHRQMLATFSMHQITAALQHKITALQSGTGFATPSLTFYVARTSGQLNQKQ